MIVCSLPAKLETFSSNKESIHAPATSYTRLKTLTSFASEMARPFKAAIRAYKNESTCSY